ncbi:MAG: hypothetical protein AB7O37_11190 [Vicinamibacteria bacterium]
MSLSRTIRAVTTLCAVAALALPAAAAPARGGPAWCGTERDGARDAVFAHLEAQARRGPRAQEALSARDVGNVAVLVDEGDLALLANPFDLQGSGLRFVGGEPYSVTRLSLPASAAPGTPLSLGDDDATRVTLPFGFSFYGHEYSEVFVNSDGNLTFGGAESSSTARTVGRLVGGPPRIAPLLADLDPSAGGRVETRSAGGAFTVAWVEVPRFEQADKNSFEVTLHADGRVEFVYGSLLASGLDEGAVGIAPGAGGAVAAIDFASAAAAGGPGALVEGFRAEDAIDAVATARKFYATHGDDYQQLVVFTTRRLTESGTLAYELTVKNADSGIGVAPQDRSSAYGSAGRLESFAFMDLVGKYPADLELRFNFEDSALAVAAHEVGHRWLAGARFLDAGRVSDELLGRDQVHWSFFMNTLASHLEGNEIEDLGGNQFRTVEAGVRYSPLDQYLMGLRPADEVPPFFIVRAPSAPNAETGRPPARGVSFAGQRKDVSVQDVIAALGPRSPAPGPKSEAWRQAWILVGVGGAPDAASIERVERFRQAFEAFFARSTDGRLPLDSALR